MESKKRNRIVFLILLVIIVLLSAVCFKLLLDKNNAMQSVTELESSLAALAEKNETNEQRAIEAESLAAEYKSSYDDLMEENRENLQRAETAEQTAKEYKASYDGLLKEITDAAVQADDYQAAYNQLITDMFDDAYLAEQLGNLTIDVWHNAIWNIDDENTDEFTKTDGVFVSDFNEALDKLLEDDAFGKKIAALYTCQLEVKERMKDMLDPPDGFDNALNALKELYFSYINFTNIVIDCDGSLTSYTKDFNDADNDLIQKYRNAELYVK